MSFSGSIRYTDTVTRRMKIGPRPNQLACTPDGKLVYIPCDDASWWVIDTEKGSVVTRIATGGRPHNTLCSPDGKRMYLGPKGSYHVLIADTASGQAHRGNPALGCAAAHRHLEGREAVLCKRRHVDWL